MIDQLKAKAEHAYRTAVAAVSAAEDTLRALWEPEYRQALEEGTEAAKEYLRPMPECTAKILYFKEILDIEDGRVTNG